MKTTTTILLVFLFYSCTAQKKKDDNNACEAINTLIKERYVWKSGNYFANQLLGRIIQESNIDADCDKGTFGYLYKNDSTFNADIEKWKLYFKCE